MGSSILGTLNVLLPTWCDYMPSVITAENLGKKYTLNHRAGNQRYVALRDVVSEGVKNLGRICIGKRRSLVSDMEREEFWALKDISFEVKQGDRIGIIGRNGAGKSTLLKILSRISEPTVGSVRIKGRIASLLEVGTGFHPELTGRENIFLNGAILGMSRAEINKKFDEIVDFAEIERFLDTPVKRYSSGMYVRLAFAVAAHLEPEILVVDEVLAVGDGYFQKKCLGKMEDVSAKDGRTVIFVSHNLGAITTLCTNCILLNAGTIIKNGNCREVVSYYLNKDNKMYTPLPISKSEGATHEVRLLNIVVYQEGITTNTIDCRKPFVVSIKYRIETPMNNSRLFFILRNEKGDILFGTSDCDFADTISMKQPGTFVSNIAMPRDLFKIGTVYGTFGVDIKNDRVLFSVDDAIEVHVTDSGSHLLSERHDRVGNIAPLIPWQTICVTVEMGSQSSRDLSRSTLDR